jgi:hypothetical protein
MMCHLGGTFQVLALKSKRQTKGTNSKLRFLRAISNERFRDGECKA